MSTKNSTRSNEITKEDFLALQRELESLEMDIARGQETESTDSRIAEIEAVMASAPWQLNMDTGKVEPRPMLRYEQPIGTAIGGFIVGRYAKMNGNPNTGTIVGVKDENGRVKVTVQFPEPQPLDGPEGATATRLELDWRNIASTWAPMLSRERIAEALAAQDEVFDEAHVGHYLSIAELAEKVRSQKNWAMGEVFCCAIDPERFLILKQVAPSSCEMLTISQNGFHDVLTAYRYSQDALVAQLSTYAGLEKPVSDKPVEVADVIDAASIETVDPRSLGIERANPGQKDVTLHMSGIYTLPEVEACLRDMKEVQKAVDAETERRNRLLAQRAEHARSTAALRAEQLRIIYEGTHSDYRGTAGDRWPAEHRGKPTIVIGENGASVLVLLENLTDAQISERLPFALKQQAARPASGSQTAPELKYLQTDRDNCRVYYKSGRELFAYQRENRSDFALYSCTSSGEPLSKVRNRTVDTLPDDDELFCGWARETGLFRADNAATVSQTSVSAIDVPAVDDIGDSVDEITEGVEKVLRAHGIEPGRDWQEVSDEVRGTLPTLSALLKEASVRLEEANERASFCRP